MAIDHPDLPTPEQSRKYPLEIKVIQPGLIYEQAKRTPFEHRGHRLELGNYQHPGDDFLGEKAEARLFVQALTNIGQPIKDVDRVFHTTINFGQPQGFISPEEGQKLAVALEMAGYNGATYSRKRGSEENSILSGIKINRGEFEVYIGLGYISPEVVQESYRESRKKDEAKPVEQWHSQGQKDQTLAWRDSVIANPLQVNGLGVSVGARPHGTTSPDMSIPLDSEGRVKEALELKAAVTQDFHLLLNQLKGVAPVSKELTLKPQALGADERVAEELAQTNAPVSRELALPDEVTFTEIAGYEPEVENMKDIGFMLKGRDPLAPKGVLLYGPPGTGKTTFAKAFASECKDFATFTPIEMGAIFTSYMHESANKLRKFLEQAQKRTHDEGKQTAIIFLDELEAVATSIEDARGGTLVDDRKEVRKVLLEWLDGIRNIRNPWDAVPVFMVGASNFKEVLDEALLRSGRIEEHVFLGEPNKEGLAKIIKLKAGKFDFLDQGIDWDSLAPDLEGVSGADVEKLFRKAYRQVVVRAQRSGVTPRQVKLEDLQVLVPQVVMDRNRAKQEIREKRRIGFNT